MSKIIFFSAFLVMCMVVSNDSVGSVKPKIRASLQKLYDRKGEGGTLDIFIIMKPSTRTILDKFATKDFEKKFHTKKEKRAEMVKMMKELTMKSQLPVIDALMDVVPKENIKSYYILNRIGVNGITLRSLRSALVFNDVDEVVEQRVFELIDGLEMDPTLSVPKESFTYGLNQIDVFEAWRYSTGKSVVTGLIDTGIYPSHEAFKGKIIIWSDPYRNSPNQPNDLMGHGTHVAATMAAARKVGVAKDSDIIVACRGCGLITGCHEDKLLECAEFVFCPSFQENCINGADVINNSWGGKGTAEDFYDWYQVLMTWSEGGLAHVFAAGNEGSCNSVAYPANFDLTIAVAASTEWKDIADFSSNGICPKTKPDLTAPGNKVLSASSWNRDGYRKMSGTSMAAPHVAGTIALMLEHDPDLTMAEVKCILTNTTEYTTKGCECSMRECRNGFNPCFGYGILNAYKAVEMLRSYNPCLSYRKSE